MKKGFTLIELLAVIVILAIIALIATPIILGIIEDARIGSIEASANGYIDAVEYQIARDEIKGAETSSGIYDVSELEIDLDGSKPKYGKVILEKGKVEEASLCIDNFMVLFKENTSEVIGTCNSAYNEIILNGADPVLKDELVPVIINDDGTVQKADIKMNWYNYSNKRWANAVILFDKDNYKAGEEIKEESIKEYYVWIPKYAYRLWNVNSNNTDNVEKPIEIVFGSKAKTTGTSNGDMYVHPAFTNFDTQGIWVGKFETSYNEKKFIDKTTFLNDWAYEFSENDSKKLLIKPNIRSLTNKNVNDFYTFLKGSHSNLNSHMMTNMEWGAAAYLTYSIYGRCDNNSCSEVVLNNVNIGYYGSSPVTQYQSEWSSTITGCAADYSGESVISNSNSCKNMYNSSKGYLASTTGNITGIYDMSGGNSEFVLSLLKDTDGNIIFENSGLTMQILTDTRYYNLYDWSTDWNYYLNSKLGDAIKEIANNKSEKTTGLWFKDYAMFSTNSQPCLTRGGGWWNSPVSGMFDFEQARCNANQAISTRAVLAF